MANLVGDPRQHRSARWILAAFYLLLTLGGLSMIYPFWIMLTRSISSELDYKDRTLVPAYLTNRDELFLKFLTRRYTDFEFMKFVYGGEGILRPSDYRVGLKAPDQAPPAELIADWRDFLTQQARAPYMLLADLPTTTPIYQEYLREKFRGTDSGADGLSDVERMNRAYHQLLTAFEFVELPEKPFGHRTGVPGEPLIFRDLATFMAGLDPACLLPVGQDFQWHRWTLRNGADATSWNRFLSDSWPESLQEDGRIISPEGDWRAFLNARYESDAALAAAWHQPDASRKTALLPYREMDAALFVGREGKIRWQMATDNYATVLGFLLHRGNAIPNTFALVGLAVLASLILNPLAAYALSRYGGRHGKIPLLLMVLTIAFPAEVTMIPSFLLLRDIGLLNTYAALVLPGAVSGFSVFLLKGFFDGLPEELFEAARIDGAGELLMFRTIAMPLSAPILAVTALGTFTVTYGGYMWALLVCQDPRMWTLMVWVFQFQMTNETKPWLGMAAFALASIPTLLVFVFCQRIILRGIIIPTEK